MRRTETITPALAEIYLKRNCRNNRPFKEAKIKQYALDMKNGDWEIDNPQNCISFDKNGNLLDGQNRLRAIILSEVPIRMDVCTDLDPNIHMFDRGTPRSVSDSIVYSGLDKSICTPHTVATVKLVSRYVYAIPQYQLSDSVISRYLKEFGEFVLLADKISQGNGRNALTRNAAVYGAVYCALRYGVSENTLREFISVVNSGIPNTSGQEGALLFRRYCVDEKLSTNRAVGGNNYRKNTFDVCLKAIYDFVNQNTRKKPYRLPVGSESIYLLYVVKEDKEFVKGIVNR